jgi:hypothetical protein
LDVVPTRRTVLGGAALAALAGCTGVEPAAAPPPGPQVRLLEGAIRSETALIALYDAVLASHRGLRGRLGPLRDHHAQHLAVLRRHYVPGTGSATPSPPGPRPLAPDGQARAIGALRTAERRAAASRADEVRRAAPGLAQLLASIGACEAGHAQVLA